MRERTDVLNFKNIDVITFSIFMALITIGGIMVYSVTRDELEFIETLDFFSTTIGKQIIWIGISLFVSFFILLIDWKFWQTFAYLIYGISLFLLVAVLIFGTTIKGAKSWFIFGGFSFQPSEVAKFGASLAMASFLSSYNTNLKHLPSQLTAFAIFGIPMLLILQQPDAGSALVFLSFFILLFREGLSSNYYLIGLSGATILVLGLIIPPFHLVSALLLIAMAILVTNFKKKNYWMLGVVTLAILSFFSIYKAWLPGNIVFFINAGLATLLGFYGVAKRNGQMVRALMAAIILGSGLAVASNFAYNKILQPHQQERIKVWLQPSECDPRGALYNVLQSKMAIGSGGFQGKGYGNGTMTSLNYVPEQSTDFIFCAIGEEQGFVGSFGLITLFLLLIIRITILAERQKSPFSRHYAYAISGMLFFHFFINLGMTMGLMPIIGIPLPFISKGGSSLLGFTIMLAVLLKLDSNRLRL